MANESGNKPSRNSLTNRGRKNQNRKNPVDPNPDSPQSDRPRGFPPSARDANHGEMGDPRGQNDPRANDGQGRYGNLADHPAFSQPDANSSDDRASGWQSQPSSPQMPPATGYSGASYIPPNQTQSHQNQSGQNHPSQNQPSGYDPGHNQRMADYTNNPSHPNPGQQWGHSPQTPEQWQDETRYAPPEVRQPIYPQPNQNTPPHNLAAANPTGTRTTVPYNNDLPQHPGPHPAQMAPAHSAGHGPVPHGSAAHGSTTHGGPVHPSSGYAGLPHRPAPSQTELPRQSGSAGKTILKILGWTVLLSVVLMALVFGGGWLTIRNMATNILNPSTQATIITKAPVVASLKQVNKQIMVEHNNMVDVDYSEAPEGWLAMLPIEQSFVVLLRGRVPAGFDLSDLKEDDIWISNDGSKIQLVLPPPVVFEDNVAVNFDESRVVTEGDTCPNFICAGDLEAIQQTIIPQGRQLLIETSRQSGIMEQAAEMGISYYESLLRSLGFEDIQVLIRSDLEFQQATE